MHEENKAIVDSRLHPRCAVCTTTKSNSMAQLVDIRSKFDYLFQNGADILPVPHVTWPIVGKHDVINKPEVRNVFHCRQRRTEPRPRVTCMENFVKFGRTIFEICERADRHTITLIAILRIPTGDEVTNVSLTGNKCALSVRPSLSADLSPCTGCYKLPVVDIVRWSCSSSAIVPPK